MADETQCAELHFADAKEDPRTNRRPVGPPVRWSEAGQHWGPIGSEAFGLRRLDFWLGVLLLAVTFVLSAAVPRLLPRYTVATIGGSPVKVDNWTGRINGLTTRITPPEAPAGQ